MSKVNVGGSPLLSSTRMIAVAAWNCQRRFARCNLYLRAMIHRIRVVPHLRIDLAGRWMLGASA